VELDLDARLAALQSAVDAGRGVVDDSDLAAASALVRRAGERLGHGLEHTVVALAGATGSGKSSLFNALAGEDLSTVGVRRPTTSTTHACSWGGDATALLDWLAVGRRHVSAAPGLDGLVLLDLPDHDSTALAHRREVDRVVAVADMVVWVLDPQKYADRAVHEGYLRPLAGHAGVLLVALHQTDRLTPDELAACRTDLARLLAGDGLAEVALLTTSVRQAQGIDELRRALASRVAARQTALERLAADADRVAAALAGACTGASPHGAVGESSRRKVVDALIGAAGVDTVTAAVAGSYRARAAARTGWPLTRWVRRVRPDPLRRLHLGRGDGARTSLPAPTAVSVARVETALHRAGDEAGEGLALSWSDAVRNVVAGRASSLSDRLDTAVARTDLEADGAPAWWPAVGALQTLLALVAIIGGVWLGLLAGLAYLRLGDLDTPEAGALPLPLPTVMLLGGVLAGLLLAMVARWMASVGGRRRARRARARLELSVREVAEAEVFEPIAEVLDRHTRFCDGVQALQRPSR